MDCGASPTSSPSLTRSVAQRQATAKWRAKNIQTVRDKDRERASKLRALRIPKTDEQKAAQRSYHRKWTDKNREKKNARQRSPESREINSNWRLRRQERLMGRPKPAACEVCGESRKRICWDHDHKTGQARGWLCVGCNSAIGLTNERPDALRMLADYLERHAPRP